MANLGLHRGSWGIRLGSCDGALDVGLGRLDVAQISVSIYLLPVFGLLLSIITLHQGVGLTQIGGGILVAASTTVLTVYEGRLEKARGSGKPLPIAGELPATANEVRPDTRSQSKRYDWTSMCYNFVGGYSVATRQTRNRSSFIRDSRYAFNANARSDDRLVEGRNLQAGQQASSQKELVERFGVSRTGVREALQMMAALHLIEIRPGLGCFVKRVSPEYIISADVLAILLEKEAILDVLETRKIVEAGTAALATVRGQPEDFWAMEDVLTKIDRTIQRGESVADVATEFHYAGGQGFP